MRHILIGTAVLLTLLGVAQPALGGTSMDAQSASMGGQPGVQATALVGPGEKLLAGEEAGGGIFGSRVATSADGNTALIGGSFDNGEAGAAWVLTRSGSAWTQQAKLTVGTGQLLFGGALALSANGDVALVGAPGAGAAWVFTRSGSTWTKNAALTGEGQFGSSVALSAQGDTAVIGSWNANHGAGAAWVYTRSGEAWTQQAKIPSDAETKSVPPAGRPDLPEVKEELNCKGGQLPQSERSEVEQKEIKRELEVRKEEIFTHEVEKRVKQLEAEKKAKLTEAEMHQVETEVLKAIEDEVMSQRRLGKAKTTEAEKLAWDKEVIHLGELADEEGNLPGEYGQGAFGGSVALSANGDVALIGAGGNLRTAKRLKCKESDQVGAAWVYTRSGSTWSQGAKLTPAGGAIGGFGWAVALSSEGTTALVGDCCENSAYDDNVGVGSAWVFTGEKASWSPQGGKLTGPGESGEGGFGSSVALTSDGNTALIGAPWDNQFAGAAWLYTRSESEWTAHEKLTGAGELGQGAFGTSVALSSDGSAALIGGCCDNEKAGAVWAWPGSPPVAQAHAVTQGQALQAGTTSSTSTPRAIGAKTLPTKLAFGLPPHQWALSLTRARKAIARHVSHIQSCRRTGSTEVSCAVVVHNRHSHARAVLRKGRVRVHVA